MGTLVSSDIIKIDLHGMRFIEAKTELLDSIEGYFRQGFTTFEIIHGFQGGTVLRDYVRGNLKRDFENSIKSCSLICQRSTKGSTIVTLKLFKY